MSRQPKPSTHGQPDAAALTHQQRERLNDIRSPVPRDHPNRAAEPLLSSKALGMEVLNAVRRSGVAQELEERLDRAGTHRGPKRRISVEALLVAKIIAASGPARCHTRAAVALALIGLDADVAHELGLCDTDQWQQVTYKTVARRLKALEALLTAEHPSEGFLRA